MEQLDIFESEPYEYLLVIEPDKKTTQKIIQLRMLVNNIISLSEEILHLKSHISICYFEASDFSDDHIPYESKASSFIHSTPFTIQVEGSEFSKNGTLILKFSSDENTLKLQEQLSLIFKGIIKICI